MVHIQLSLWQTSVNISETIIIAYNINLLHLSMKAERMISQVSINLQKYKPVDELARALLSFKPGRVMSNASSPRVLSRVSRIQ